MWSLQNYLNGTSNKWSEAKKMYSSKEKISLNNPGNDYQKLKGE